MAYDFSLSPSKLNLFRECERCAYDANILKIERPRGIFPSLPGGVDRVMKLCLDRYRGGMPPHLQAAMSGTLWGTVPQITKLRNWRSGLKALLPIKGKMVNLIGALDDLIVEKDETYSPWDTKTKGAEPQNDGAEYYQVQMDCYALMLRENGMTPSMKAYLDYWFPITLNQEGMVMSWGSKLYTLNVNPARAVEVLEKAVTVLTGGQPEPNPSCEHCRFAQFRVEAALKTIAQPAIQQAMAAMA